MKRKTSVKKLKVKSEVTDPIFDPEKTMQLVNKELKRKKVQIEVLKKIIDNQSNN